MLCRRVCCHQQLTKQVKSVSAAACTIPFSLQRKPHGPHACSQVRLHDVQSCNHISRSCIFSRCLTGWMQAAIMTTVSGLRPLPPPGTPDPWMDAEAWIDQLATCLAHEVTNMPEVGCLWLTPACPCTASECSASQGCCGCACWCCMQLLIICSCPGSRLAVKIGFFGGSYLCLMPHAFPC